MGIEESARILNQLEYFAEQAGTRYVHEWQAGDVVVWDNRSVQHRAAPKATVTPGAFGHRLEVNATRQELAVICWPGSTLTIQPRSLYALIPVVLIHGTGERRVMWQLMVDGEVPS